MREDCKDMGKRIKYLRGLLDFTGKDLAEATGVSASFLSEVENQNKSLAAVRLNRVAKLFGVPMEYLLVGEIQVGHIRTDMMRVIEARIKEAESR